MHELIIMSKLKVHKKGDISFENLIKSLVQLWAIFEIIFEWNITWEIYPTERQNCMTELLLNLEETIQGQLDLLKETGRRA